MTTKHYNVADHLFAIEAKENIFALLSNYTPFETDQIGATHVFIIHAEDAPLYAAEGWESVYTDRSDEDMPRIEMYRKDGEWLFLISVNRETEVVCSIRCDREWSDVHVAMLEGYERFAIDNTAMLIYAFCTVSRRTLLFHSSVTGAFGNGQEHPFAPMVGSV